MNTHDGNGIELSLNESGWIAVIDFSVISHMACGPPATRISKGRKMLAAF
ncbi:MAG: hypothetical protein ACRD5J_00765 [Nitrososphaeraceae archaeon]